MNKPSALAYLFGNPISALASMLAAIYWGYLALVGQGSWLIALPIVMLAMYCGKQYERVERYRLWKREWDAMGGEVRTFRLPNLGSLRLLVGMAVWFLVAIYIYQPTTDPTMKFAGVWFTLATIVLIIGAIYTALKKRGAPTRVKQVDVSVCLPMAQGSPSMQQMYAQLPDYCYPLFRQPAGQQSVHN